MARDCPPTPRPSPRKRQRTMEPVPESPRLAEEASSGGGEASPCCGICLQSSAGGNIIRGQIDSCDHYFCFQCIREWSRVESKCPMCKQRFSTILRPAIEGVFNTERVVYVPLRDQVYDPLRIRTFDPYAKAKCSVCSGSGDEWLLLLCDLCDAASHTYCVGLGYTVPMDDWVCHECTILRDSQANGEESDEEQSSLLRSIVREGSSSRLNRTVILSPPQSNPPFSVPIGGQVPVTASDGRAPMFGARTRHHCRDVHSRIQAIRENWDELRRGAVSFSSGPSEPVDKNSQKQQQMQMRAYERDKSGETSSSGFQQSTDRRGEQSGSCSRDKTPCNDVKKAWRMMDLAKSRRRGRDSTIKVQHAAKDVDMNRNASDSGGCIYRNLSHPSTYSSFGERKPEHRAFQSPYHLAKHGAAKISAESSNFHYPGTISVARGDGVGAYGNQGTGIATVSNVGSHQKPSQIVTSGNSREGASNAANVKSEVQSLVKHNLKLLTSGKRLGADAFKEIARASTHNVLAAWGLEHSKSIRYHSFTRPACPHQQHEATPMPDCCSECFEAFVKNVVGTILQEKAGRAR